MQDKQIVLKHEYKTLSCFLTFSCTGDGKKTPGIQGQIFTAGDFFLFYEFALCTIVQLVCVFR